MNNSKEKKRCINYFVQLLRTSYVICVVMFITTGEYYGYGYYFYALLYESSVRIFFSNDDRMARMSFIVLDL